MQTKPMNSNNITGILGFWRCRRGHPLSFVPRFRRERQAPPLVAEAEMFLCRKESSNVLSQTATIPLTITNEQVMDAKQVCLMCPLMFSLSCPSVVL
jgi:hypothetical protein